MNKKTNKAAAREWRDQALLDALDATCSFCIKDDAEVQIITGPTANICAECVRLCNEILEARKKS